MLIISTLLHILISLGELWIIKDQKNFRPLTLDLYNGTKDSLNHVQSFKSLMIFLGASDEMMCRSFLLTLKNTTWNWYYTLKPNSINSFEEFVQQFISHFASSRKLKKNAMSLLEVRQHNDETLMEYISRFNWEALQIVDLSISNTIQALLKGLKERPL